MKFIELKLLFLIVLITILYTDLIAQKVVIPQNDSWLLEITFEDVGTVKTIMKFEFEDGSYKAYSRKKAAQDVLGVTTYTLGRLFTSRFNKNGSLLVIDEGKWFVSEDTIHLLGKFKSLLGNYDLEGTIINNEMKASVIKCDEVGFTLIGHPAKIELPLADYNAIYEEAFDYTQKYIYDLSLLEHKKWKRFDKKIKKKLPKIKTDLEMIFAFAFLSEKLPFSHYSIIKTNEFDLSEEEPQLELMTKDKNAYIDVKSFMGTVEEVDSFMAIIKTGGYETLMIDFRSNGGGSIAPGLALVKHIVDTSFYGGVLLSRKWFDQHNDLPKIGDYEKFSSFSETDLDLLIDNMHQKEGVCLKVVPYETTYSGKLFVLTNEYTGSTCEPIVYGLQQIGRATVVGEKTAGAMLSAEAFSLQAGFSLFLPTATYYTSDGYKIDGKGVQPDIKVKSRNAFIYVRDNFIRKK